MSTPRRFAQRLARWFFLTVSVAVFVGRLNAAETIPDKPTRYFNDYANVVKPEVAERLNRELEDLEKQSSDQVLVAIYPKMQSDGDVSEYCLRIFRKWEVGQKGKNNGAVLFVFVENHKTWIQTGRGLEGALPDATCKDITADVIAPKLKANDFDGGLTAGVEAMIAATKGEYKGNGTTVYQREHPGGQGGDTSRGLPVGFGFFLFFLFIIVMGFFNGRRRGGTMFGGGGPIFIPTSFGGSSGSGGGIFGGGGGGSSDGGGFFSSGGGDTGGGGAGSDW